MRNVVLAPLGWLFGGVIAVRNWLYDVGIAKAHRVDVPVIAVGNITTGGTGKTPCALLILEILLNGGRKPALISRGYGRKSKGTVVISDGKNILVSVNDAGDEALLVARRFPSVIVVVSERRIDAARAAMSLGADCIVADDAFQHRALHRELDIVMTGDELSHRAHYLLPSGDGREPVRSLVRAGIIISTSHAEADVKRSVAKRSPVKVIFADVVTQSVIDPRTGNTVSYGTIRGKAVVLLTGIANPERVSASLRRIGATIAAVYSYSDHHWFTPDELRRVVQSAKSANAMIVTTEKDWVRLSAVAESSVIFSDVELRMVRVTLQMRHGGGQFTAKVLMQLQ